MIKQKLFEIGTSGGSITGYEIKDEQGKTLKFGYTTGEYYDDEFQSHTENEIQAPDFIEFWYQMLDIYPLYQLYPEFIHEDYKIHVRKITESLLKEDKNFSFRKEQKWIEILGLNQDEYNDRKIRRQQKRKFEKMIQKLHKGAQGDVFTDILYYVASNKDFQLDLKDFLYIESAFRQVWNKHSGQILGDGDMKNKIYRILEPQIKKREIDYIEQAVVDQTVDLILNYMQSTQRYTQNDDIWDDTPDIEASDDLKYTAYYRQINKDLRETLKKNINRNNK